MPAAHRASEPQSSQELPERCDNIGMGELAWIQKSIRTDKMMQLSQQACDGGVTDACFNLSLYYNYGKKIKQDHSKARRLFQSVCDVNDAVACYRSAYYPQGTGVEKNYEAAKAYSGKTCNYYGEKTGTQNIGCTAFIAKG